MRIKGATPFVETYKIEDNIPVPSLRGPTSELRDTVRKMKPMQSIMVPLKLRATLGSAAKDIFGPGKYTTRRIGTTHVRLWRLKK